MTGFDRLSAVGKGFWTRLGEAVVIAIANTYNPHSRVNDWDPLSTKSLGDAIQKALREAKLSVEHDLQPLNNALPIKQGVPRFEGKHSCSRYVF